MSESTAESWCVWEVKQAMPISGFPVEFMSSRCDVILIRIMLRKIRFVEGSDITSQELLADRRMKAVPRAELLSNSSYDMAKILSSMGVPKKEQPDIIRKLIEMVEVAVPLIPVVVDLRETSMQRLLGATAPATISAMRRLKKMTLGPAQMKDIDSKMSRLKVKGVKGEVIVIPSSCNTCVLCSKLFKFDGVEQLTRFPTCSHLFHGYCLNKWLLATDLCPVCQCPLDRLREDW